MKGIILAGGSGTRLYPVTQVVSKQLLPIYDKPMIYYPLSTLMLAGIRDILIVSTPQDTPRFEQLLGDGSHWGISLKYIVQPSPDGLPQAFILGKEFLAGQACTLILGDNIFYGHDLTMLLKQAVKNVRGGHIFAYPVNDPWRHGIVELDPDGRILSLEEKPREPRSRLAIVGLYVFDSRASEIAAGLRPSARNELEIVDMQRAYLAAGELEATIMGRGYAWLDTGTHESMLEASSFIETIERRQGLKIGCPEEIAFRAGYITAAELEALARPLAKSGYGEYLKRVLAERVY